MVRVLVVEDDKYLGEALKDYLNDSGFVCNWIYDDRELFLYLNSNSYDIVILDLILKFSRGEDLLKSIKVKYDIPVIVLTAKGSIEDKEACFSLGADDYITKPFDPRELVLRINSILKRDKGQVVEIKGVVIDLIKKTIKSGEEYLYLTRKEWEVLEFLVKNRGKIVSPSDILNYVWQEEDVGEDSVRTYIKRLRNLLGKDMIKNKKGRGYLIP